MYPTEILLFVFNSGLSFRIPRRRATEILHKRMGILVIWTVHFGGELSVQREGPAVEAEPLPGTYRGADMQRVVPTGGRQNGGVM